MAKAIYPGTFDPITLGHMDVIETAAKIFEKVYVAILVNQGKKPMFGADERVKMINLAIKAKNLENVEITSSEGLTVDLAKSLDADFMIRGLRLNTDYEYELFLHFNNQKLDHQIETILIPPKQDLVHISSTAVRTLLAHRDYKTLGSYLPKVVSDYVLCESKGAK